MEENNHNMSVKNLNHDTETDKADQQLAIIEKVDETKNTEDEWEDYIPEPPDGGYGWVVMIASFFNNFILDGISYCFGVFFPEYLKVFDSSVSSTSLANSLLCGVYLLVGPIVGALVNKFGCRPVGIAGSIIGSIAFILSTFSNSVGIFQLTYGLLGGFGFGMMYLPAVVGVGFYFEKKRAIATGIAVCGTGIGTFCLAPVGKLLLKHFDWKNAHYLLAGLILHGCISSALMKPLQPQKRRKVKKPQEDGDKEKGDEEKKLIAMQENGQPHKRMRTTSKNILGSNQLLGSRLVIADSSTPANLLHASAFLHSADSPAGSKIDMQNLSKPLYRKDIFYSGSVMNVNQVKSQMSLKSYVASISSLPDQMTSDRLACLNYLPKPIADILAEMLDLKILKNKGMLVLCFANFMGMLGFYVPIVYSTSRAQLLGVTGEKAALLLSIMGICNTIGRILSGCLSFFPSISPLLVNNICVTLAGIAVILTPFCKTFLTMAVAIAAYGLFAATFISLASVIICDLVGLEKLTNGFGLLCLVRGITAIAGPPLLGQLFDITGSYAATFHTGGACIVISGILHSLLFLRVFKRVEP